VGCGTAVLAMAAARLWPGLPVLASDIDPVAVDVARANLEANAMAGAVTCIEAAGLDHPEIAAAAPFELIFANILKGPLVALAPDLTSNLAPGGIAILSGILEDQAAVVIETYEGCGNSLLRQDRIDEWVTLVLRKSA
jgi:ribosomal protein L11 methyltransferase